MGEEKRIEKETEERIREIAARLDEFVDGSWDIVDILAAVKLYVERYFEANINAVEWIDPENAVDASERVMEACDLLERAAGEIAGLLQRYPGLQGKPKLMWLG